MSEATFVVPARGIGRRDYSMATEMSVEPVVTSYQTGYYYCEMHTVPANDSLEIEILIPVNRVIILYDFEASIPAYHLLQMVIETCDALGVCVPIIDKTGYQTVAAYLSKGYPFQNKILATLYNYQELEETRFWLRMSGLYTSEEEYTLELYTG